MIFSSVMSTETVKQLRPKKTERREKEQKIGKHMKNKTNKKDNKKTLWGQGLGQKRSWPKAVNILGHSGNRAKSGLGQKRSLPKAVGPKAVTILSYWRS